MRVSQAIATFVSTLTTVALVSIPAASASSKVSPSMTPPPSGTHYISVSQALTVERGKYYGPNAWTGGGRATINGFTRDSAGKYHRTLSMTQPPSPTFADTASVDGPRPMIADSWYNPGTWDWGHILGTTWSYLWDHCLKGATTGYIGAVGTNLATELLIKGALVTSWEGYAAVAFGGCVANFAIQ